MFIVLTAIRMIDFFGVFLKRLWHSNDSLCHLNVLFDSLPQQDFHFSLRSFNSILTYSFYLFFASFSKLFVFQAHSFTDDFIFFDLSHHFGFLCTIFLAFSLQLNQVLSILFQYLFIEFTLLHDTIFLKQGHLQFLLFLPHLLHHCKFSKHQLILLFFHLYLV